MKSRLPPGERIASTVSPIVRVPVPGRSMTSFVAAEMATPPTRRPVTWARTCDLARPLSAVAVAAERSDEAVISPPSSDTAPPVTVVRADACEPPAEASTDVRAAATRTALPSPG